MSRIEANTGGAVYGQTSGYGGGYGHRAAYADIPADAWELALADATATNEASSQSAGQSLFSNNRETREYIGKVRQANDLRALIGEFVNLFPIPSGKESHNPKLKQLDDILKQRAADNEDASYTAGQAYDKTKLAELNKALKEIGMVPMSEESTKGEFESLKTKIDSLREESSSLQGFAGNKQGLYVGNLNAYQTGNQGLTKTKTSIMLGWARLTGAV